MSQERKPLSNAELRGMVHALGEPNPEDPTRSDLTIEWQAHPLTPYHSLRLTARRTAEGHDILESYHGVVEMGGAGGTGESWYDDDPMLPPNRSFIQESLEREAEDRRKMLRRDTTRPKYPLTYRDYLADIEE